MIGIIEDEKTLAETVAQNLKLEGYESSLFGSAESFLESEASTQQKIDVLLVDRKLPGMDGLSLVQKIRSEDKNIGILFVTGSIDPADAVEGFQAGADDYIRKPFSNEELIERIKNTLRLKQLEKKMGTEQLQLDDMARELSSSGKKVRFTQTEYDLLKVLLKKKNQVVERDKLSQKFPHLNTGTSRSLDVHISAIRKKISTLGLELETIRGIGYRILAAA